MSACDPAGTPQWLTRATVATILVLYLPALLSFGAHVAEHVVPFGFTRGAPPSADPILVGVLRSLLWLGRHCAAPTWCGVALGLVASARLPLSVVARGGLGAISAVAFVSMRGIEAVLQSCWGEAPHAFWIPFRV